MPDHTSSALVDALRQAIGSANVLVDGDLSNYEQDWRKRVKGRALAVVRPGSTLEVAAVVKACAAANTPIVPQGGNTGLVAGGVPDSSGLQIVLSTGRMCCRNTGSAGSTARQESRIQSSFLGASGVVKSLESC